MKAVVIVEQHFYKLNDLYWAEVQCDRKFWGRYLEVFDELVVCARVKEIDEKFDTSKLIRSDRDKVIFKEVEEFRGPTGIIKKYFSISKSIKDAIKEGDCIIFRVPSPMIMVAYKFIRNSKKPYAAELVVNPRTAFSKASIKHPLQPFIKYFFTKQTKKICKNANGVSYVTDYVLQNEYPCRSMEQRNSKKYFNSSYSTIRLEKKNYIFNEWDKKLPHEIILVHCGGMGDYRKGQDVFIETIHKLTIRGLNVKGVLIGDGPLRYDFEKLGVSLGIEKKLEFVGWKAGLDEVQKELVKAHIFMFPTASEGLPRSVIEAMATGLICVGYAVDGMVELLDKNQLVYKRTSDEFSKVIANLIDNWDEVEDIRKKLFEKSHKYNNYNLQKRRKDFYERLRLCCSEKI